MKILGICEPELSPLLSGAMAETGLPLDVVEARLLFGDGSDRRFFRVRRGAAHFIALVSPGRKRDGTDENDSYFRIGRHLERCGIPVPHILWADVSRGHFLLEDAGDMHLQRFAQRGVADVSRLYRSVLHLLAQMHRKAPEGFEPGYCFDTPLYDAPFVYSRELEYFRKAFLISYLGLEVPEEDLRHDFENLAEAAGAHECRQVMHRDFQSRNIMVYRGNLKLLDFQGMRYGPSAYDLASLLIDPYVDLSVRFQEELAQFYWSAAAGFLGYSSRAFRNSFAVTRLCRNLQVLGAYGYLGKVKGKKHFLQYIPRAWKQLHAWINGPCRGRYPQLQRLVNGAREVGESVSR